MLYKQGHVVVSCAFLWLTGLRREGPRNYQCFYSNPMPSITDKKRNVPLGAICRFILPYWAETMQCAMLLKSDREGVASVYHNCNCLFDFRPKPLYRFGCYTPS